MTLQTWLIYLLCVLAATATPGPAVLFIITNTSLYGWRKASFAALGNIVGLLILGIIAITGLGALLDTSERVFNLLKYTGAAYLVYLGIKLFFRQDFKLNDLQNCHNPADKTPTLLIIQACGVALSNPKAIVFLTALFPQFIQVEQPLFFQFVILISTLMFFSFVALMFFALLAHKAKSWLMRPQRIKRFNQIGGSVFIGFGALLATARR